MRRWLLTCGLLCGVGWAQQAPDLVVYTPDFSVRLTRDAAMPFVSHLGPLQKPPFQLPLRHLPPGYRLLMLAAPGAVPGPVHELLVPPAFPGQGSVTYHFPAAPKGQDRLLELFVFDGHNFDLLGRSAGNAVNGAPLDLQPFAGRDHTPLYFVGLSFTKTQYRAMCLKIGGRLSGAYCGPK